MNIKLMNMVSNAWIVGDLVDEDAQYVSLKKPIQLVPTAQGDGKILLQLIPYNLVDPDAVCRFSIGNIQCVMVDPVPETLVDQYVTVTSSLDLSTTITH